MTTKIKICGLILIASVSPGFVSNLQITHSKIIFNLMNFIDYYKSIIIFFSKNFSGLLLIFIFYYSLFMVIHNWMIRKKFGSHKGRFKIQRCFEDGYGYDENGIARFENEDKVKVLKDNAFEEVDIEQDMYKRRDYFYLVDHDEKTYHRIMSTYTRDNLGYAKPSRENNECFKLKKGYNRGEDVMIYNVISDFSEIINAIKK